MFNLSPIPVPDLSGKTILVTGAGHGIGSVLAEILVSNGARVFAGVNNVINASEEARLSGARVVELDVTSQVNVDAVMAQIRSDTGQLDVLVNNAGVITPIGHLKDIKSDDLAPAFNVNVIGIHRMIRAALPLLRASKGAIVNAGTGAATTAMEGWTAYCSSKAAARMLTQMSALELSGDGIQSFFIGIPPTDTDMQGEIRASGLNPISKIPQTDLVDPAVPASVMAWLCGPEARKLEEVMLDVRDDRFSAMMGK